MSVACEKIRPCIRKPPLTPPSGFPLSAFSTKRTRSYAVYRLQPSGTGALAAAGSHPGGRHPGESRARGATPGPWTSHRTPTCWVSISATGTSCTGRETCTCWRSPAPMTGRPHGGGTAGDGGRHADLERVRRQANRMHHDQELFKTLGVPISAARARTQASAENRAGALARGHRAKYPGEFARGLFHSDGWRGVNRVRRTLADGDHWYEYPRYLFGNESADILRLCGEALDQLGVAWRYSRRNSISVARRGAVARLDEFVGPKY